MSTPKKRFRYDRSKLRHPIYFKDIERTPLEPLMPPAKPDGSKRHADMREIVTRSRYIQSIGCRLCAIGKGIFPDDTIQGSNMCCNETVGSVKYAARFI